MVSLYCENLLKRPPVCTCIRVVEAVKKELATVLFEPLIAHGDALKGVALAAILLDDEELCAHRISGL